MCILEHDGESEGAAVSSAESSGMIIRGGADGAGGGDSISTSGEASGSATGGCGSAGLGSVLAGTGLEGTTSGDLPRGS